MREGIYYWKCDAPLPVEEKRASLRKYAQADISDLVARITREHLGEDPLEVTPNDNPGNHYTYVVNLRDRKIFFRGDDGKLDDEYMLAEAEAMRLARDAGVPVPRLHHTDVTMRDHPVRYQLLEFVEADTLDVLYNDDRLDRRKIALELGTHLARMHRVTLDGFGFIDTQRLRGGGETVGMHRSHGAYFRTRLEEHLGFLVDHRFLSRAEAARIDGLLDDHASVVEIERGSLVHKDIAFWNILGDTDRIRAIIDWDDVIAGDPMDDIAILGCFYDRDVMEPLLEGYRRAAALPPDYRLRIALYLVRNMIWKAVIRITMGYFDDPDTCFMVEPGRRRSARELTYRRLQDAVEQLASGKGADL